MIINTKNPGFDIQRFDTLAHTLQDSLTRSQGMEAGDYRVGIENALEANCRRLMDRLRISDAAMRDYCATTQAMGNPTQNEKVLAIQDAMKKHPWERA